MLLQLAMLRKLCLLLPIAAISGLSTTQLQQSSAVISEQSSAVISAMASAPINEARSLDMHTMETSKPLRDVIYHLHIPKVAGVSFMIDELAVLTPHKLKQISMEGCFSYQDQDSRVLGTSLLLRDPRQHLVSMYDFCCEWKDWRESVRPQGAPDIPEKFEGWVREWRQRQDAGWHGDFTPLVTGNLSDSITNKFQSRSSDWSNPPWSPEPTRLDVRDWTRLDGGGTIWHTTSVPFQCYAPIDFQTQRLSCQKAMEFPVLPDLPSALKNLESAWFVGLVEQYQASICLLWLKLGERPPAFCDCSHPEQWQRFPGTHHNVNHRATTNFSALSRDILSEMDQLASADWQLYKAGERRFVREVREMERKHNIKLLCSSS